MAKRRANGEGTMFQRSDGRWQGALTVGYTTSGSQKRRAVYGRTQREVREKLDKLKREFALGIVPDKSLTVDDYLSHWLVEKARSVKLRTKENYEYTVKHYIIPHLGRRRLDQLKPIHVQSMVSSLADAVSPDCANRARRVLFSAMKQAVRWQMISSNPVDAVQPLKVQSREMTLWTSEEAAAFLDHVRGDRFYSLYYLAMSTGLRRGELLGLHWDDLEGTKLRVRRSLSVKNGEFRLSTPKTKRGERSVSLTLDTVNVLEEHRERQLAEQRTRGPLWRRPEVMFPSEVGDYMDTNNLSRQWRRHLNSIDVRPIRLHDLRHLHASIAIRAGVDPKMLADRLGHSRASFTLDVYTHLFDEQREAAAVSVQSLLAPSKDSATEPS